jgi:hypothetical protein
MATLNNPLSHSFDRDVRAAHYVFPALTFRADELGHVGAASADTRELQLAQMRRNLG